MVGEIHVQATYLVHAGGTKFYEVIAFSNVDAKKFTLVKRWGKLAAADGGGECKVETYSTQRKLEEAAGKIISSKQGRDYGIATSAHGFNPMGVSYNRAEDFNDALSRHYSSGGAVAEVLIGMGIEDLAPREWEENEVVSETPEPEPERDEDYGSW